MLFIYLLFLKPVSTKISCDQYCKDISGKHDDFCANNTVCNYYGITSCSDKTLCSYDASCDDVCRSKTSIFTDYCNKFSKRCNSDSSVQCSSIHYECFPLSSFSLPTTERPFRVLKPPPFITNGVGLTTVTPTVVEPQVQAVVLSAKVTDSESKIVLIISIAVVSLLVSILLLVLWKRRRRAHMLPVFTEPSNKNMRKQLRYGCKGIRHTFIEKRVGEKEKRKLRCKTCCVHLTSNVPFFECKTCDSRFCISCAPGEEPGGSNCLLALCCLAGNNHRLSEDINFTNNTWSCAKCFVKQQKLSAKFSCKRCKFHVCHDCSRHWIAVRSTRAFSDTSSVQTVREIDHTPRI
jgi:hypothetical protein